MKSLNIANENIENVDKAIKYLGYLLEYENKHPPIDDNDEDFHDYVADIEYTIAGIKEIKNDLKVYNRIIRLLKKLFLKICITNEFDEFYKNTDYYLVSKDTYKILIDLKSMVLMKCWDL